MPERSSEASNRVAAGPVPAGQRASAALPSPLVPFLGREAELSEVIALLDSGEARLLTLTGPGGVGKTRLAIEVARRTEADFADGVRFIPLASIRDPGRVVTTVTQVVGARERAGFSELDSLAAKLRDMHLLLVLDNFEHLLSAPADWLARLLEACPRLTVLATSRIALNIGGEQRYQVPTLPVPETHDLAAVSAPLAARLFEQRARAVRPEFSIDGTNSAAIAGICRRLDGLPLAIELAAARIGMMTSDEILSGLSERLELLAGGQLDAPIRLRSMRDAVAWSYDLLSAAEQQVFRRLAVFVGGFTLKAAEAVCGESATSMMTLVASLVDQSMLRVVSDAGQTRYHMLETIREFGLEQLVASGEEADVRDRHAAWCVAVVFEVVDESIIVWLPDPSRMALLDAEQSNLRAALSWLDETGNTGDLTRLVLQLRYFWYLGLRESRESEGHSWYTRILAVNPPSSPQYADALRFAGHLAEALEEPTAGTLLQEALGLAVALGDVHREAEARFFLATLAEHAGRYAEAEHGLEVARGLLESLTHTWKVVICDFHFGVVAYGRGDLERARTILEYVLFIAEAHDYVHVVAWCRHFLIMIAADQKIPEQALPMLAKLRSSFSSTASNSLDLLCSASGLVAVATGDYRRAARMFAAAIREYHDLPFPMPERDTYSDAAARARREIGDEAFTQASLDGRRMSRDQILAEIDTILTDSSPGTDPAASHTRGDSGLSARELEVLRLLADGLTNQEIADALYVTRRTASTHIEHILTKLDARSRTAAVAYAIRNGLA